jgi:hypothetical protein
MATAPFKVKAIFEYTSSHEDDLPFEIGQIMTITDVEDPDWYGGEYVDASGEKREGIFPRNFVEKYEPTAPPRPTRSRKKESEPAAAPPPPAAEPEPVSEPVQEPEEVEEETPIASPPPPAPAEPRSPRAPTAPVPKLAEPGPVASSTAPIPPKPEPAAQSPAKAAGPARSGPPPVSEKPASNSFKDRIAAFNKSAAPPIAPFKPSGLTSAGGSAFIKKPFVAPPPSRNAYVPPPKEVPTTKLYRRDEDPEIKEREAENVEQAAKAGLAPAGSQEDQDEDQPKPTSLKERIALLQKQQAEAANRHADVVAKKEKPKRPPKKRTESEGPQDAVAPESSEALPPLERRNTESMDEAQPQAPPRQPLPTRRKSSKGPPADGNEADMSGAGETTEGPDDLTEREDSDVQPKPISRAPTGASTGHEKAEDAEKGEDDEEAGEEEEEEDDDDPEVRRREELRARMAKMSVGMGGMGMMGMHNPFAAPMGPGASSSAAKKKKPPPPERRSSEQADEEASPRMAAPPIPVLGMMALPGMSQKKPKEEEAGEAEDSESDVEESTPVTASSPRGMAPERK